MRIGGGRVLMGLFVLLAARGCYSSIAPVPRVDPGDPDPIDPIIEQPDAGGCVPRKPWEGPGVTGVLPISSNTALVLNGDRYFTAEFDTQGTDAGDPNLGRLVAWRDIGLLKDLWADAPPAVGRQPWDDPGVTAVYTTKGGAQVIISGFRRWVYEAKTWTAAGSVVDDWLVNDAGPPPVGGTAPWEGAGVTAAYFTPSGASFYVLSQKKAWVRRTFDADPKNWTWRDAGFELSDFRTDAGFFDSPNWATAPVVEGQRIHEGKGVTAAYYIGPKLFVVSVDKMWVYNGQGWAASGSLRTMAGWTSAPSGGCGP